MVPTVASSDQTCTTLSAGQPTTYRSGRIRFRNPARKLLVETHLAHQYTILVISGRRFVAQEVV
jgi:hypothetical protein